MTDTVDTVAINNEEKENYLREEFDMLAEYTTALRKTIKSADGKNDFKKKSKKMKKKNGLPSMNYMRYMLGSNKDDFDNKLEGIFAKALTFKHKKKHEYDCAVENVDANNTENIDGDLATKENKILTKNIDWPVCYDHEVCKEMVRYTSAAYCPCHNASTMECGCDVNFQLVPPGFTITLIKENEEYDSKGFVGYNNDTKKIVASFRGTRSMANWINNVKAIYINGKENGLGDDASGVRLHMGFFETYDSVGPELVDELVKLKEKFPDHDVYITGHSLGGAMATFCALMATLRGLEVKVYTFGQPRCGNKAFVKFFHSKVKVFFRIHNTFDVVPHLPGRALGFEHVGTLLWYKSNLNVKDRARIKAKGIKSISGDKPEDIMTKDELVSVKEVHVPFYKLTVLDHIVYYERITGLKRLRGEPEPEDFIQPDGRVIVVTDSIFSTLNDPNFNVLLLIYDTESKEAKKSSKKAKEELLKVAHYFKDNDEITIAEINAGKNDIPPLLTAQIKEYNSTYPALLFCPCNIPHEQILTHKYYIDDLEMRSDDIIKYLEKNSSDCNKVNPDFRNRQILPPS